MSSTVMLRRITNVDIRENVGWLKTDTTYCNLSVRNNFNITVLCVVQNQCCAGYQEHFIDVFTNTILRTFNSLSVSHYMDIFSKSGAAGALLAEI